MYRPHDSISPEFAVREWKNNVNMTSLATHLNDNNSVAFILAAQSNKQCDRIWIEQQLVNFNIWLRDTFSKEKI